MSTTISSSINFVHQATASSFGVSSIRTTVEDGFSVESVEVPASPTLISFSDFNNARHVMLRLMSGSDLKVGLASGTYPFRLSGANDVMILRLDIEGLVETQTVQTVADVADSLDTTYFVVTDANAETWAIGFGTLTHAEDNEVSVTITTGDTAAAVAAALYAALVADASFSALFDVSYDAATDDDLVTITDKTVGTRTNIADTGTTGFTLATTQAGAAQPTVYMESEATSQVLVGLIPE